MSSLIPPEDFRRILIAAPALYLILLPDLTIVDATDAYLQATLTERGDVIGRALFDVFPDNPAEEDATGVSNLRMSLEHVIKYAVPHVMPVQKYDIRRPESEGGGFEERYWSPMNSPVLVNGALTYIIHRVEDVTEFIRLRRQGSEQTKIAEEMQSRVGEMESEIYMRAHQVEEANRSLRTANEELGTLYARTREIDELKSRFFANVSHELRTPLSLVLGPVRKLIPSPELPDSARHDLIVAERNARLLLRHVDDLLDISKLEAGQMGLHYMRVDTARLVRFVASHFDGIAADRDIEFSINTADPTTAEIDAVKVERILVNLLSNAFKFSESGGKVSISVHGNAETVSFLVGDSGPGIPEDQRSVVFERFRRLDRGVDQSAGGTGLGLSIVKEFTVLHRGRVVIDKSEFGGALFEVSLPRTAPPGEPVLESTTHENMPARPGFLSGKVEVTDRDTGAPDVRHSRRGRRSDEEQRPHHAKSVPLVLVVEDNPDMQEFIAGVFEQTYRVISAPNARAGLAAIKQREPDLIVTDLMMAGMSGDEMVRELRTGEHMTDIPIIVLTAKSDDDLRVRLLKEGVEDYLSKPFRAEELLARAARLIGNRVDKREARRATESWRQAFLRDVLLSVTEGKLAICATADDLPERGPMLGSSIALVPDSLRAVRHRMGIVGNAQGWDTIRTDDLLTATSEAAMNAIVHAGGGILSVHAGIGGALQVWIEDSGRGIDLGQLPRVTLEKGYSTSGSLGHGFFMILRCIDRLHLLTGPTGTTIVLVKERAEPEPDWLSSYGQ